MLRFPVALANYGFLKKLKLLAKAKGRSAYHRLLFCFGSLKERQLLLFPFFFSFLCVVNIYTNEFVIYIKFGV